MEIEFDLLPFCQPDLFKSAGKSCPNGFSPAVDLLKIIATLKYQKSGLKNAFLKYFLFRHLRKNCLMLACLQKTTHFTVNQMFTYWIPAHSKNTRNWKTVKTIFRCFSQWKKPKWKKILHQCIFLESCQPCLFGFRSSFNFFFCSWFLNNRYIM